MAPQGGQAKTQGGQTQGGQTQGAQTQGGQAATQGHRPAPGQPGGPIPPAPTPSGGAAQVGARPQVTAGRPVRPAVQPAPPGTPRLGGWTAGIAGADRGRTAQVWRQQHHGWDSNAVWRRNRSWWRGDFAFRLFVGPRPGFWFIPRFGYVAVPVIYQRHYWRPGEYLPEWFWRFEVVDYWRYGLPEPPYGTAWIWLNDNVALVDLSDGYIIDIVYGVW